ncbi:MAG: hypothetical protein C4519_20540 [Desulfobacteraceae bacterium]|nr:MAG: hypothetical protein C4519_20540 [Desulfobacteraceae bacterium]
MRLKPAIEISMPSTPQAIKKLDKFLDYALGRHPDEFGLLPDLRGFVKIKTLLQALHEDSEWRHIREGHLRSLMLMQQPAAIEIQEDLIRARNREHLPVAAIATELPRVLFTTVRRRAYPVILIKGIRPGGAPTILLATDTALAQRLGQRTDNAPVLITVKTALAHSAGTVFQKYGEQLYLADFIPAQTFSGPPLPKEKPADAPSKATAAADQPKMPGSYFPDPAIFEKPATPPHQRRKREMEWKKDRRRARKGPLMEIDGRAGDSADSHLLPLHTRKIEKFPFKWKNV